MVQLDKEHMRSTRWWRVIGPDKKLWCETSDEDEARRYMRPGDKLQRLYTETVYSWFDEEK